MTYRGVYRDGVIVLSGEVELRNGDTVDVTPTKQPSSRFPKSKLARRKPARPARTSKKKATKASKHPLPGFGGWKHRTDIGDTAEFARELRRRTSARRD